MWIAQEGFMIFLSASCSTALRLKLELTKMLSGWVSKAWASITI